MNKQNFSYVLRCVSFPILNYSSRVDSEQPSTALTNNYNQSIIKNRVGIQTWIALETISIKRLKYLKYLIIKNKTWLENSVKKRRNQ